MINQKSRATLIGVAAAYMLYIAYQLFDGRNNPESTMSPAVNTLFIIFFILAAIGLGIYAYRIWKKPEKEDGQEQPEKDSDAMK